MTTESAPTWWCSPIRRAGRQMCDGQTGALAGELDECLAEAWRALGRGRAQRDAGRAERRRSRSGTHESQPYAPERPMTPAAEPAGVRRPRGARRPDGRRAGAHARGGRFGAATRATRGAGDRGLLQAPAVAAVRRRRPGDRRVGVPRRGSHGAAGRARAPRARRGRPAARRGDAAPVRAHRADDHDGDHRRERSADAPRARDGEEGRRHALPDGLLGPFRPISRSAAGAARR